MKDTQILLSEDSNMVNHLIFLFFVLNIILLLGFIVLPETKAASYAISEIARTY